MPRYSNPEIISAIHNGNEEVLFYVSWKFFQPARRWLRRKGVPDEKTPEIFISILLKVFREIQQQRLSVHIDFESFLFNSLDDHFRQERTKGREERFKTESSFSDENKEIVAQCVSILDEENRKLLFSRYAEKLSFEQIAVRFNYSNPVIAQFEVNKAMNRLEAISRIQLNIETKDMLTAPEERILIDAYLEGKLSGLELQSFMERLDADPAFRGRVSLQNLIVEGIQKSADKELRNKLLASVAYRKPRIPLGLKLIFTFLFVTISGIVIWNYIGPDPDSGKIYLLTFSWLPHAGGDRSGKKDDLANADDKQSKSMKAKSERKEPSGIAEREKEKSTEQNQDLKDTVVSDESVHQEVVVKQDQLLITVSLEILEDTLSLKNRSKEMHDKETTLSSGVLEKLGPAAGLGPPEMNSSGHELAELLVEFWVSPVNYRGYKFHRNKLILFGIAEPDMVRLIREDGVLYMKYVNDFYRLDPAEDYTSFVQVKGKIFSTQSER